jgi:hypothetical protein
MRLSRRERRIWHRISKHFRATDPRPASILEDSGQEDKDAGKNGSYMPFVLF